MRAVIERNMVTGDSKVYRSIVDAANSHDVSPRAIWGSINDKSSLGDFKFEYMNGLPPLEKTKRVLAKKDSKLDDSYELRSFEMRHNRICITPCYRKYQKDGSNIMIGSALCQQCPSFRGINRHEMKLACSFKYIQQKDDIN